LDAVRAAENDTAAALKIVKELRDSSNSAASAVLPLHTRTAQCTDLEEDLMSSIKMLKSRNRIFGSLLTIEELISPPEERENEDNLQSLNDDEIVAQVHYEKALEQGEIIEIDSEEEEDDNLLPQVTTAKALEMCQILSSFCLESGAGSAMELSRILRRFRAEVSQDYMKNMKQSILVDLWGSK
jgi:hypothetical protein